MTDIRRATVTMSQSQAGRIQSQLSSLDFSVQVLRIQGRYHNRSAYEKSVACLKQLFELDTRFQLPGPEHLNMPLRSNIDGQLISHGSLENIALDSILLEQCQWYGTVHQATMHCGIRGSDIARVGAEAVIPRSLAGTSPSVSGISTNGKTGTGGTDDTAQVTDGESNGSSVAVVGMACRYPDADSLEEFWELLSAGHSAVRPLPSGRFDAAEVAREPRGPMWGNFVRNPDHFDHRFFGISGREAKYMDPQQRLVLQVAYEALESSGYFGVTAARGMSSVDVGCYLGVGAVDYGDNIASHDATAFSALGTLRAFISGRVSHYFGWSGPSITYDTACSSGAVAIHAAVTVSTKSDLLTAGTTYRVTLTG